VGEQQRRSGLERLAYALVELLLCRIGNQQCHEVRPLHGLRGLRHLQSVPAGLLPARAAAANADDDVEAGVLQIERVRAPLAAEAQDRNARAFECLAVDIFL